MTTPNYIDLVERAYRFELDEDAWLRGISEAIRPVFDGGQGILGLSLRVAGLQASSAELLAAVPLDLAPQAFQVSERLTHELAMETARRFRISGPVNSLRRMLGREGPRFMNHVLPLGIADALYILAGNVAGALCVFAAPRPEPVRLDRELRYALAHVAAHIASACRLRRALEQPGGRAQTVEATLSPSGKVLDAEGAAKTPAGLAVLRHCALASERARGSLRRRDPEGALLLWRALVAGRWSILDRFDTDGRRFLIARRNEPQLHGQAPLSAREQTVGRLAAQGYSNKLIAYELGLSISTVTTHLARVKAKLGLSTRADLSTFFFASLPASGEHAAGAGRS